MMEHWRNKTFDTIQEIIDGVLHVEEWRAIENYEGLYEVSSFGRVKSLLRIVPHKTSYKKTIPQRILSINKDAQGYLLAQLWKDNVCFHGLIQRLVASAFIANPFNLPEVNHTKGVKAHNHYSQLEWVTSSGNQKHSYTVLNRKGSSYGKFGKDNKLSKKVKCTTLDIEFDSFGIAAKELGVTQSAISMVCLGIRKHTQGLHFKYA